ncbi:MAG: zinc-ribbon domain containing protein [Bacillota bacterium]
MEFEDKVLQCRDCGNDFVFTVGEQEFYAEKGFQNLPARCPECRRNRRGQANRSFNSEREMFDVICSSCGCETQVPFKPRGDRPVYCWNCFRSASSY